MNKLLLCLTIIIIFSVAFILINKQQTTKTNNKTQIAQNNIDGSSQNRKGLEHYYHYLFENNISEVSANVDQKIEILNKYLEQYPENLNVIQKRARIYSSNEKYDKAIKDYAYIIAQNPNNIEYINEYADCYIEKYDFNQAKNILDKYYANIEKGADYYYLNGKIQQGLKKYNLALDFYNKAIELNGKNDMYYLSRAMVYKELKMFEESSKDIQTSIKIGESKKSPKERLGKNN